mmetsp:Transcript_601/g.1046  ORF Transcript_601/g.1046 Transcript_601/m.1046 type:complete len:94 (-) Transcript_601:76-357(-)
MTHASLATRELGGTSRPVWPCIPSVPSAVPGASQQHWTRRHAKSTDWESCAHVVSDAHQHSACLQVIDACLAISASGREEPGPAVKKVPNHQL